MLTIPPLASTESAHCAQKPPNVTVLMPVYNGSSHLDAAVASILQQTYSDFEFLIVDDGSTDATLEVLHGWQKRDPRIRVLSGPHQGISASLNRGLREARGSIIVRMDADDIAAPGRIEQQVAFLDDHPEIAAVGSAIRYIDAEGKPGFVANYPQTPSAALAALSTGNSPMAHSAVAMRRSSVLSVGGYRSLFDGAEDFDLWMRLTESHQISNLPHALLDYRIHNNKLSVTRRWEQALAAYIARFSLQARRHGFFDPTDQASKLELHHLEQLNLSRGDRAAVLTDLAAAALVSFEAQGANAYLRHARDCLFALNELNSERVRRAARTLIWYFWRTGDRARAVEVAAWMVRRRVPLAILNAGALNKNHTTRSGGRLINEWLVHCADPTAARASPPPGILSAAQLKQLVDEAEAHGVLPALLRNLPDFANADCYVHVREDTRARQRVTQSFSAILRHHGEAISAAAADLPVTTVKGRTFARLLYPDPRLRPFTDIDLLVAPAAVEALNAVLADQGFEFVAHDHDPQRQEAKWLHRDSPLLMVEVHTNLVHHPKLRASLSLTYDDIADEPEAPAALLAIACLHGALHRFERLRQVVDICQAARNLTKPDDEIQLNKLLERTGGRFATIASLDLAYRIFHESRCREIAEGLGSVRHRFLARALVDRSAALSTMNQTRFFHSWRRQMFRLLLQRSRQF